jgi:hypothetical protein
MKKMSWVSLGNKCDLYFEVPDEAPDGIAGWLLNAEELSKQQEYKDKYLYVLDLLSRTSKKLHQVSEDSADIFFHAANHHLPYTGATYEEELKEIDKFLKKVT